MAIKVKTGKARDWDVAFGIDEAIEVETGKLYKGGL